MSGFLKAYVSLGWTPILALEEDGERVVLKIVSWLGGTGSAPAINTYIGATGIVNDIQNAVNIKGTIIDVVTEFPVSPVEGRIYIKVDP